MLRALLIGLAGLVVGLALDGFGVPGGGWFALLAAGALVVLIYVVPWLVWRPTLRDIAIIIVWSLAAIAVAIGLEALGAPKWLITGWYVAVLIAYVCIPDRVDEVPELRSKPPTRQRIRRVRTRRIRRR